MISCDEIVSHIKLCLLNGDSKSVGFLENFVLDSWNWDPIIYIIQQKLIDDYLLHFTFTMASRRIKLFGVSDINDLQSLFNTILSKANSYDDSNTTIINDITKILSLLTINSPSNDIFGYVDIVKNSLVTSQGNRISFLLLYLTDIGMVGLSAENNQRLYLKEMSTAVLELCRTSVTTNVIYSNPRSSDISIACNAINCINQWIIADLMAWNVILPIGNHHTLDTVRFLGVVSPLVTVTYPTICQALTELLETIIDKKKSETITMSSSELIDDDAFAGLSTTLIQNITQHADLYFQTLNTSNSSLACSAYLRLTCLTATLLGPYISSIECQHLLQLIVLSTKHASLKVAGIAIEIFPEIHRFLSKLKRKQCPHIKELYPVLLESMLMHAVMPTVFGDLHDDGSIDEEEWLTYREQSISNVLLICYYELRTHALMIILNGIHNNSIDSYQSNNNHISTNSLEAKWYCMRILIFEICKRALLHGASSSALLAASKASPAMESPQEVGEDASQTSSILYSLLGLILQNQSQGGSHPVSIASPPIAREICRILGLCSTWMSRVKDSDGKEQNVAVRSTPVLPVKEVINLTFYYLLNAISSPSSVYRATASLRSLCQHCVESLISSDNLNTLLLAWTRLCYADDTYRYAIEEERFGQLMEGEGNSNYLLESQKAMLKSCCLLLSHCPVEVIEEFQCRLLEPMLTILHSGLHENRSTNLSAICGMIDLLAFFVRSIRLPSRPLSNNGTGLNSLTTNDAFTAHPSVQLMGQCGTLFLDLLKKYPSESQSLGTSISYLMTSLVTFIAPLAPITSLPDFLHFTWSTHMKHIITLNYSAASDFVSECIDILGPVGEKAARLQYLSSSSSTTLLSSYSSSSESLEPAAYVVFGAIQEMFTTMHSVMLCSNSTTSVISSTPSTACTMLGSIVVIEYCDLFFSLLSKALTVIPVTLFALKEIDSCYQMAKLGLLEYTQPSLIRSTVMLLTTLMNLDSTVGFVDGDPDAMPSDCSLVWSYLSPKVKTLESQFNSIALEVCLENIVGNCPEMLVEVFGTLLFRLIKNGLLYQKGYYVSDDYKEILQIKARVRGALNYTDDLISLFFMICNYVTPKQSTNTAIPFNHSKGYILSEFLDVCGMVWKVAAGETNIDALRNYATQKATMM